MPYLKPKMNEYERKNVEDLLIKYAEENPDTSGKIFLKIIDFIEGLMNDVYHFTDSGN